MEQKINEFKDRLMETEEILVKLLEMSIDVTTALKRYPKAAELLPVLAEVEESIRVTEVLISELQDGLEEAYVANMENIGELEEDENPST